MKKMIIINTIGLLLVICSGLGGARESDQTLKNVGYFYGYSFGNLLKEGGTTEVDLDSFMAGVQDSLKGTAPNLSPEQQASATKVITQRQQAVQAQKQALVAQREAKADAESKINREAANAFLAGNARKKGVKSTASGLQYEDLTSGAGVRPVVTSIVRVHYEGKLLDGKTFDSSIERGTPAEFALNQVIPGWTEGLQLMKAGGKARFYIPPDLAYGPSGARGIPPNSLLIFEVELLEVK